MNDTNCPAPDAHNHIEDNLETRPFNEEKVVDGQWNYVHRMKSHEAVDKAVKEGVVLFGAWLVDNAEGETITEELLLLWGSKCIKENYSNDL